MRKVRPVVNAVLVAVFVRPMLRRSMARWRRKARDSAQATIVIPVAEALETVLPARLEPAVASLRPTAEEVGAVAERDLRRSVLMVAAVAGLAVASALVILALRRRRRAAATTPAGAKEPVAISVDAPAAESEAADMEAGTTPPRA